MNALLPVGHQRESTMAMATFDGQATEHDAWFEKHPDLYLAESDAVRSFIPASGSGVEIGTKIIYWTR